VDSSLEALEAMKVKMERNPRREIYSREGG